MLVTTEKLPNQMLSQILFACTVSDDEFSWVHEMPLCQLYICLNDLLISTGVMAVRYLLIVLLLTLCTCSFFYLWAETIKLLMNSDDVSDINCYTSYLFDFFTTLTFCISWHWRTVSTTTPALQNIQYHDIIIRDWLSQFSSVEAFIDSAIITAVTTAPDRVQTANTVSTRIELVQEHMGFGSDPTIRWDRTIIMWRV